MTRLYTLEDLTAGGRDLYGTRVLVRVDFNVPLSETGEVLDATRIEEALPTVRELAAAGARVILASHYGRPKGKPDPRYSLRPVAEELVSRLGTPVRFAADTVGAGAREVVAALEPGGVCLLENLRFDAGETAGDPGFADALAAFAEAYVGEAFGAAHRAHASVVGVPERVRRRAAGRLMVREVESLSRLLGEPERPFVALLGGAKIEGKIDTLENLLPRLDVLLVGGGMANTFLAARGLDLADSLVERERLDVARDILARAEELGIEVVLPRDLVVTDDLESRGIVETVPPDRVPAGRKAVDVGAATRAEFAERIAGAGTLFWNGPLGVFEKPPFDAGTRAVAQALTGCPGYSVIGGGETVAAARQAGVLGAIGHVSTGGGAALELLAGKTLPGVAVLEREGT
jgi:phosphoglycerate kinase